MKKFVIQLLVFTLFFGSAEAAFCSVSMFIDHDIDEKLLIDNYEQNSVDNETDICDHFCQCAHPIGMLYSNSLSSILAVSLTKPFDYEEYYSQFPPRLLRPPII